LRLEHFDLISDVLPFGRLWYGEPNAVSNAIGYATRFAAARKSSPCSLLPRVPLVRSRIRLQNAAMRRKRRRIAAAIALTLFLIAVIVNHL
jgi:hypothetical protein